MARRSNVSLVLALVLAACGGDKKEGGDADAKKKAYETAAQELKQPVAVIAAYLPYVAPPDTSDKYAPKRPSDQERAATHAANEIRHTANGARQKIAKASSEATKDLEAALAKVSQDCTEPTEPGSLDVCKTAIKVFDETLGKAESASGGVKFPRVGPEAVNEEAKKALTTFLKVRGPGTQEKAYFAKRADPKATPDDVIGACQAALGEADDIARAHEKADEPLRIIAATHKMTVETQCSKLNAAQGLLKGLEECKKTKKTKSPECSLACGKSKTMIEDGIPAASFAALEAIYGEICK